MLWVWQGPPQWGPIAQRRAESRFPTSGPAANGHGCGWAEPPIGLDWSYLSGMEKDLQNPAPPVSSRAPGSKCLPGQQAMVAEDFIQDPEIRDWLAGVEPAWTLLTFESLQALRREPSAIQTAIWIANDLSVGEIASSPVARNTLILLREAIGPARSNRQPIQCCCSGRDVEWPDYD